MEGFGINSVQPSGFATTVRKYLLNSEHFCLTAKKWEEK
jgi:hypothetical protein